MAGPMPGVISMKKISFRFTLWVSLPLIFAFGLTIFAITSFLNTQIMEEKHKVVDQKLELANSDLSALIGTIRSFHSSLCRDERLKALMYEQRDGKITSELRQSLSDVCGAYRSRNTSLLVSILPISLDGVVLDNIYAQSAPDGYFNRTLFEHFAQSFAYGGLFAINGSTKNNITLTYYGSYYDMANFEKLGFLAINIRASRFFMEIPKLLGPSFSQIFVMDESLNPVYTFSNELYSDILPHDFEIIANKFNNRLVIDGHTYLVYHRMIEAYPSWSIVGLIDYNDMMQQTRNASILVANIFVVTALLLIGICFFITRKITDPILRINAAMRQMSEGDWPEPVESRTFDEMHSLVTGFNNMTESVKKLTEIQIAEQEEKRHIETSMLQGKLDLLQSQINPHFIHNTLNTMKYMALKNDNKELYETIVSFNNLLRGSISSDSRFSTVTDEIGYLESYVHIQKKRYDEDRLIFNAWFDEEAADALLPRLILQPLVENALFHGILPTRRNGRIDVTIMAEDSELVVSINDNGQGIDPEIREKLLDGTFYNTRGYNKIGLSNVMDRIKLYYPGTSKFYISSQPGCGTMIMFKIPYMSKEGQ